MLPPGIRYLTSQVRGNMFFEMKPRSIRSSFRGAHKNSSLEALASFINSNLSGMPCQRTGFVKRGCPAFSLVELLAVVAIIGILTSLLLPAISRSEQKAAQAFCIGNLRQLGLGLQNFVFENQEYPRGWAGTNGELWGPWNLQIERGGLGVSKPNRGFFIKGVWRCPSARWRTKFEPDITPASYGYNESGASAGDIRNNAHGLGGRFISNSNLFAAIRNRKWLFLVI